MKKILFLVQLPTPVHGAAVMNEYLVESELIRSKYEVRVLPLKFSREIADIGSLAFWKMAAFVVVFFKLIRQLLRKPDLVYYTFSPLGRALYRDAVLVLIVKLFRVPLVYHMHGRGINAKYQNGTWPTRRILEAVFKDVKVICLSERLTTDITSVYAYSPFIVSNGIKSPKEGVRRQGKRKLRLIYLSNLLKEKGILVFLETLNILKEQNLDFEARVIGSEYDVTFGQVRDFLEQHELRGMVRVLGPKYGNDKIEELHQADILILPTSNDSYPLVILEAMSTSVAVISTRVGSIPDMLDDGENGILVESGNPSAIALEVVQLSDNPQKLKSIQNNAHEKFQRQFTLDQFENNMLKVFAQIIG